MRLRGAFLVVGLAVALLGCESPRKLPQLDAGPQALTWPPPPEMARYAYAGTLIGEEDFIQRTRGDEFKDFARSAIEFIADTILGRAQLPELERPVAGLQDGAGRVVVTDGSLPGVMLFDMGEKRTRQWRLATPTQDFKSPVGIAADGAGGYLVADSELGFVARLDSQGQPRGTLGSGVLQRPTGLARDPESGLIYVVDTGVHQIVVLDPEGRELRRIGQRGVEPGAFNFPSHLVLHQGALYVSDSLNFRIQKLDLQGKPLLVFGQQGQKMGDLSRPKGVAVGGEGRIYVVDSMLDYVLVFDAEGRLLMPLGGSGGDEGLFYLPAGVWTDDAGRVYVADMFNGRISVFKELTGMDGGS